MIVSLANPGSFRRVRHPRAALPAPPPSLPVSRWAAASLLFHPDPLQAQILDSPAHRLILLCSRQFGKSTLAAIKALHFALAHPGSTTLVVSPTLRRSAEWLRLVKNFFSILANPATNNAFATESSPRACTRATQNTPPAENSPRACARASCLALRLDHRAFAVEVGACASASKQFLALLCI